MRHSRVIGVLKLSRADGAVLAFLIFFVPCYLHSGNPWRSAAIGSPIFLMALCTFILNNINDIERDRINHPHRPIPSGLISLELAAALYFILFLIAIVSVYEFIPDSVEYVYFTAFLLAINYNTIVNNLPLLKNAYAAIGHTLPIVFVWLICGPDSVSLLLAPAAFLFSLGREILMDLRDSRGDGPTWVKSLAASRVMAIGFSSQGAGILVLAGCITNTVEIAAWVLIGTSFALLVILSRRSVPLSTVIQAMKVQFATGLVFLF